MIAQHHHASAAGPPSQFHLLSGRLRARFEANREPRTKLFFIFHSQWWAAGDSSSVAVQFSFSANSRIVKFQSGSARSIHHSRLTLLSGVHTSRLSPLEQRATGVFRRLSGREQSATLLVEELTSLVKDNLPCKHLILSVEELLVNFLEEDASVNKVLELKPMNPYNRLLVHRLADIFGFSHQSVGEEESRHLVLERCLETSMPPILVSDLVLQFDERLPSMTFDKSRWNEVMPGMPISQSAMEQGISVADIFDTDLEAFWPLV
ncbi:Unknown protein [Striga hermonthica]|uniref:R3H domain-containing protein n=1 Tax=Striga hermonthica TaxID=68872 RepID=A0A9N7RR82_STRHE|nr:Unknown protein [Striga hermonthica]